jgi:hypothetical protein
MVDPFGLFPARGFQLGKSEHKTVIDLGVACLASFSGLGHVFGMQVMRKEHRR